MPFDSGGSQEYDVAPPLRRGYRLSALFAAGCCDGKMEGLRLGKRVLPRRVVDGDAGRLDDGHRLATGAYSTAMGIALSRTSPKLMAITTTPGGVLS